MSDELSIQELFDADPLTLTQQDRSRIIARQRELRQNHINGIKAPRAAKPKSTFSLDDLGDLDV